MKKNGLPLLIALLSAVCGLQAQKTVATDEQLWLGAFNQTRFSGKLGMWAELQLRLKEDYVNDLSLGIARFGLTYYLNDDVRLTAGYAYVHHFPAAGHSADARPEHRPWQQVQWFTRFTKARLMQWVRLEERYLRKIGNDELAPGYQFNYRIRYNAALTLPLTKKGFEPGGLQFLLNDEVMVNFGEQIVYNHFDQNRLFLALVYQISKQSNIQGGYMNLYQQLPAGNAFRNQHTVRFAYFHNLDWR